MERGRSWPLYREGLTKKNRKQKKMWDYRGREKGDKEPETEKTV